MKKPPSPINLNAPEVPQDYEPRRRERFELPEIDDVPIGIPRGKGRDDDYDSGRGLGVFKAAQKSYASKKMPPPPPPMRPGDMQRRRPPQMDRTPIRGARKPSPNNKPSPMQRISSFRINPLIFSIIGWGALAVVAVIISVWFVSGLLVDNALAVYLDDELIGFIAVPQGEELTSEEFHNRAVLSLQAARGGLRVQVDQRVTIESARASGSARMGHTDMMGLLSRRFTYQIAAVAIYVRGERKAILRTISDLQHVEYLLQERWFNEYTVRAEFVEGWETQMLYVPQDYDGFDSPEQAYWRLDVNKRQIYVHTVEDGENLSVIAVRFGTTVNNIMRDNNLTSPNIRPGEQFQILTYLPLLAVRTFDEVTHRELLEMPVEEIPTPNLPLAFTNVVQEGQAGQQEVTTRIIRESGIERSRETLEAVVVVPPIVHRVEVGTGAASVEIR
ncbi:MAG: G5 domain-containing protein [Defluviitaleaceae bacterium]|nr:G5 domain-containing protein [Defluviitaleaceae bacterium]